MIFSKMDKEAVSDPDLEPEVDETGLFKGDESE